MTTADAPGDDVALDELARVVDDMARRYVMALALSIGARSSCNEAREAAMAQGGETAARQILANMEGRIEDVGRRVDTIAPTVGAKGALVLNEMRKGLHSLLDLVETIRNAAKSCDAEILEILGDPLAERLPGLALALCASGVPAVAAMEVMQTIGLSGGVAPSVDPGGCRLQ